MWRLFDVSRSYGTQQNMSKHDISTIRSESKFDRKSSVSTFTFSWKRKSVESSSSRGNVFSRLSPPNPKGSHSLTQSAGNKAKRRSVFERLGPVASVQTKLDTLDHSLDVKAGPSGWIPSRKPKTNGVHQTGFEVINNRLITRVMDRVKGQDPNQMASQNGLSKSSSEITDSGCQETSFQKKIFANETLNIHYVYDIHDDFDYELDLVGSDSNNGSRVTRDELHLKRIETKSDNPLWELIWENISSWDVDSRRYPASEIPNNGGFMDTGEISSENTNSLRKNVDTEITIMDGGAKLNRRKRKSTLPTNASPSKRRRFSI